MLQGEYQNIVPISLIIIEKLVPYYTETSVKGDILVFDSFSTSVNFLTPLTLSSSWLLYLCHLLDSSTSVILLTTLPLSSSWLVYRSVIVLTNDYSTSVIFLTTLPLLSSWLLYTSVIFLTTLHIPLSSSWLLPLSSSWLLPLSSSWLLYTSVIFLTTLPLSSSWQPLLHMAQSSVMWVGRSCRRCQCWIPTSRHWPSSPASWTTSRSPRHRIAIACR